MIEFIDKRGKDRLVLFIHGFTGGKETWENSKGESFPELLMKDKEIYDNYDFAYFTYYTKLISVKTTNILKKMFYKNEKYKKNVSIETLSYLLGSDIRLNCEKYNSIIIVAHSMGGLIAKSYILEEEKNGRSKIDYFISLAVPHNGSNWAVLGQKLKNPQVNNLMPLDDSIRRLNEKWIERDNDDALYVVGIFDEIVVENSGIPLKTSTKNIERCENDHTTISKPDSTSENNYLVVYKTLLNLNAKKKQKMA